VGGCGGWVRTGTYVVAGRSKEDLSAKAKNALPLL